MYATKYVVHPPPHRLHRRLIAALLVVAALAAAVMPASAQPRTLQYGVGAVGQIDAASPISLFVFSGFTDELVVVELFGLTNGFTPTLTLLGPTQQPVGAPTGSGSSISLAAVLPSDGNYTLLVGSQSGQPGEFALRIDGGMNGQAFEIAGGEQARVQIAPNGLPQVLAFDASQAGFALQLGDPFADERPQDALRFGAQVIAANGGRLAEFDGIYGALALVPSGAGRVYVIISGATQQDGGALDVTLLSPGSVSASTSTSTSTSSTTSTTSSSTTTTVQPVQTQEVTGPGSSSSGACTLIAGANGVNVRAGDGTSFAVVGNIEPNGRRAVTGRNANSSWFTIDLAGGVGWVASQVVTLDGGCTSLPVVTAGSPPQPTTSSSNPTATSSAPTSSAPTTTGPTPTHTATTAGQEPTQPTGPTNTSPPPTPTATPTTAVQTAPPDNNTHRLDVHRNNGGTLSEFVSYPDGDTTDRIEMRVDLGQVGGEATRNVTLTLNCNGSGTQNIRFTLTSPNAQRYGCGQSITVRYSAPFSTGYYYVFIEDGGPSYVNYTLVATTQP